MSFIGTALSALDTASSISSLFSGGPITLGSMVFTGFEVPSSISYGGQQQLTVHKLPGGARVLDDTGNDPHAITWSGIFLGSGCRGRRSQLDAIRLARKPVRLAWGDASFNVMVSDCSFDEGHQRINYRVSCIVVPAIRALDTQGDGTLPDTAASAYDQGMASLSSAGSALLSGDLGTAGQQLATAAGQVSGAWTSGTAANLSLSSAVSGLQTTLQSGAALATQGIALGSSFTAGDFAGAVTAAGSLARNVAASSLVTNVTTILGRA